MQGRQLLTGLWHNLSVFFLVYLCLGITPAQANSTDLYARLHTELGDILVELYPDSAPATVNNFIRYVKKGFYNNTVFHRVIPGFVIQGGGLTPELLEKATFPPVPNESGNGLFNRTGTLAMARTADPNSARAQFFINLVDNPHLNPQNGQPGYTVFGRVVAGMDVVNAITRQAQTAPKRNPDGTYSLVRIITATMVPASEISNE